VSVPVSYRAPTPKPLDTKIEVVESADELRIHVPATASRASIIIRRVFAISFAIVAAVWTAVPIALMIVEGFRFVDALYEFVVVAAIWSVAGYLFVTARRPSTESTDIVVAGGILALTDRHGASSTTSRIETAGIRAIRQRPRRVNIAGQMNFHLVEIRHANGTLHAPMRTVDEAEWVVTLLRERLVDRAAPGDQSAP